MKTSISISHLICLCLATVFSCQLSQPPPWPGHPHTGDWSRGIKGSGNGLGFGAHGVGFPRTP